ncbi:ABC transporter substrate-binding protein [Thalassobacillus devorans]|uniref:ABC transporter substrate-binding protein n=1 Tax=Thalassobacillus devorans TaxID=279813 RepID=UPI00048DA6DB|nr:ABC transporter substrate-binding protein [Thalassobacillus devorans]
MKKGLAGVVIMLLASMVLLAGCNSDASGDEKVTIGVTQIVEHPSLDAAFEGFKEALAENGYVEGENVTYDVQIAQGDMNNAQSIANNFVGDKVDLIFANATPSAQSALNATKDIPIIFTSVTDPVGANLVASFDEPGENITGTSDTHPDAIPQTINFIVDELKPESIGVIYNSGEQNSTVQVDVIKDVLKDTNVELVEASISTSAEVKQAAESLVGRADAIYIPTDNTVVSALESVIDVAQKEDIPMFAGELDSVKAGAVAGSGFSYKDLGYETGEMAAQVLDGDKEPSEIPVSYPKNLKLVINKEAAEAQGLEIKEEWGEIAEFYEGE